MIRFFLSPESAPLDVASIQNQTAREWTDWLIQKGICNWLLYQVPQGHACCPSMSCCLPAQLTSVWHGQDGLTLLMSDSQMAAGAAGRHRIGTQLNSHSVDDTDCSLKTDVSNETMENSWSNTGCKQNPLAKSTCLMVQQITEPQGKPIQSTILTKKKYLGSAVQANGCIGRLAQSIHPDGEGALGRQHSGDLALELGSGLPNEGGVVDEAILGRLVLCLQRPV